jgi:hypothetical protein
MPCDPLPPPADTPKPRPHYEEGKPLWFQYRREEHPWPFLIKSNSDVRYHHEFNVPGGWYGPFPLPWQPAALPEGHAELMRGAADALDSEASGHEMEGGSKGHARELYALAARLRAAAGGDKG